MAAALPFVIIGMQVLGTLMSVSNARADAKASSQALEYNAAVNDRNAGIARQQAAQDAEMQDRKARRIIGATRAAYGASGINVEGSPLDVLAQSAANAELDRQTILYKGELRAMGHETDATLDRFSAENAIATGNRKAGSAILLGGASIAKTAYGLRDDEKPKTSPQSGYRIGDY